MDRITTRPTMLSYPTAVWDSNLSPISKLVFIDLWSFANREGTGCWPSQRRISQDCGLSVRSVNKAIADLKDLGLVSSETRSGHSSVYSLSMGYACGAYRREPLKGAI